jgi:hypothetical protein
VLTEGVFVVVVMVAYDLAIEKKARLTVFEMRWFSSPAACVPSHYGSMERFTVGYVTNYMVCI